MTTPLTAEERKRVAEACGRSIACFEPDEIATHFRDLVRKVAERIEKRKVTGGYLKRVRRFHKALASNDANALESLLLELMEGV